MSDFNERPPYGEAFKRAFDPGANLAAQHALPCEACGSRHEGRRARSAGVEHSPQDASGPAVAPAPEPRPQDGPTPA